MAKLIQPMLYCPSGTVLVKKATTALGSLNSSVRLASVESAS